MAETKLTRDHYVLTRNLKLNDNYISNDGDDEGITIDNSGNVGMGIKTPPNNLSASPLQYSTGTASQSGTTVTGSGTTWTTAMIGSQFVYADGTSSGAITARASNTSVTVTTSQTVTSQGYKIHYQGLQVKSDGNVGIGNSAPLVLLEVGDGGADIPSYMQIASSGNDKGIGIVRLSLIHI